MSSATTGEGEAMRQKKTKKWKHVEVGVAPSQSPHASKPLPAVPLRQTPAQSPAPETPILEEAAPMRTKERKRKKRKEQQVAAPSTAQNPISEEEQVVARKKKKERKTRIPEEQMLSSPSPSAAAETPILEQEAKVTKKRKEQEPSGQSPLPFGPGQTHCVHLQGTTAPPEQEADAPKGNSMKKSNGKKPHVLSNREIIKMRIELRKQQTLPQGFVPAMSVAPSPNSDSNCTEQNPNHSSPFGAFFDQFCYKPVHQDRNPSLPRTPDRLPRLPPRGYPSFESSQLAANGTSKASKANTSVASKAKQQEEADGPKGNSMKKSNGKKPRVLSNRELIKMRMELRKQQMLPEGFAAAMSVAPSPNYISNCTEQNPNYSSPFGAFFDQFCYKPVRQDRNPLLSRTPDCLARLPPQGCPSFESSQLTANETSKASKANASVASKTKQQGSGSRSASGSQAEVNVKEYKNPEKKTRTKKQRKPPPLLASAEKRSDKYRRLPLDQLVPPPRSPHKLLQEDYASDPWKVIVICMLLNLTQGKQVRKKVDGFFRLYPDPQTAFNADPKKMEGYLAPLGLQRVKTIRIQKFSREFVEKEWTYITELCGVGKYAADAYAIFCAGRATEVVPQDHKLVDYWNYVCYELPTMQT